MTILIANIGTSDLAIKVGDYYIPIEFRDEPNLDDSELTHNEKEKIWNKRNEIIAKQVCDPLDIQYKISTNRKKEEIYSGYFRGLTQKIWELFERDEKPSYRADIKKWKNCLQPIRIGGVLNTAKKDFDLKKVYLFFTNQKSKHHQDTYYLFKILKKWFSVELPDVEIIGCEILPEINIAKQPDKLADYYYKFFRDKIKSDDRLLISVKGGTPHMQNELKMQAISSNVQKQLFLTLEPPVSDSKIKAPSIKGILEGKPANCFLTSNWRYLKAQKYQSIKLLLERWDFDGAQKILEDWQQSLDFLKNHEIPDIQEVLETKITLDKVVTGLKIALTAFNLDLQNGRNLLKPDNKIKNINWVHSIKPLKYNSVLNLYTQCRIYWQLEQTANFLFHFGSFYEEVLHYLFVNLGKDYYFNEEQKPRWSLQIDIVRKKDKKLMNLFIDREKKINLKRTKYKLNNRFSKRNFAEALVLYRRPDKQETWNQIIDSLNRLDYWFDKRNALTHGAKGISRDRLDEILTEDRKKYIPEEADAFQGDPNKACWGSEILDEMGKIYRNVEIILDRDPCPFIDRNAPEYNEVPYYIYSEAKDWVIETLDRDR